MPSCEIAGWVELEVSFRGRVLERRQGSNIVTSAGKDLVAAILEGSSSSRPTHFGFGSGTDAPAEDNTTLATEHSGGWYGRHAFATSRVSNVVAYATQSGHWINTSGGNLALSEIGIFNAATSGVLFSRFLTSPFTLVSAAVVNVRWELTLG